MSAQDAAPRETISANSRVEAIVAFVRANAETIDALGTLRVEFNFNGNNMVAKAERGFVIKETYRVGDSESERDALRNTDPARWKRIAGR